MTSSWASGGHGEGERTLTCDQCGTPQEPGQAFCDTCNAVLVWSPVASDQAPAAAKQTPAQDPPPYVPAQESPAERERPASPQPEWHTPAQPMPYAVSSPVHGAPSSPLPQASSGPSAAPAAAAPVSMPMPMAMPLPAENQDEDEDDPTEPLDTRGVRPGAGQAPAPGYSHGADPGYAAQGNSPYGPAAAGAGQGPGGGPHGGGGQPWPQSDDAAERARALLVPVDEPQARPEREQPVAPVLPGRPEPVRPGVRAPGEQQIQGGIPCPWCGTTNRPDRHFCTRCAMRMSESPDGGPRAPWWRRLFDRNNREQPWAGERPRLRWQFGRIVKYVVWAAVLGLVVWGATNVGAGVSAVRDHFASRASLAPDSVKASHSYPHHDPKLAFDKYSNTWWGPGISESGQGEWIEAHFQEPVNLLDVGITSGESAHADSLSKSARPHRMQALVTTDDGKTHTMELVLDQTSGFQSRAFRYHNVTSVRFTLGTAYGVDAKKQVAIAEIEFFGPSQGGSD